MGTASQRGQSTIYTKGFFFGGSASAPLPAALPTLEHTPNTLDPTVRLDASSQDLRVVTLGGGAESKGADLASF